jgi:lipopolysaccharide biosynthesis glycosyltransferase
MSNSIHIIYGTDDNYIFPTAVSAASAAWHVSAGTRLVIHLFDLGVKDMHYEEYSDIVHKANSAVILERHVLSPEMFQGFGAWKGSLVTYSRMMMAEILKDIDWAIYIDGDTLWLGDPCELWKLRDETKMILASIDPPTPMGQENEEFHWYKEHGLDVDPSSYLCMGLMLANLKVMRKEHIASKCQEFMQNISMPRVVDQTVLNYVCQGRMCALPKNWGVFSAWHKDVNLSMPSIVHYVSDVPWKREKLNRLFSDVVLLWFDFCKFVLQRDEIKKFSCTTVFIKRLLFLLVKWNQWILLLHPYLKSRLRNTHGIPRRTYQQIVKRWKNGRN